MLVALSLAGCGAPGVSALDASTDTAAPADADDGDMPRVATGPRLLSQTGLYKDFASRALADGIIPYEPRWPLWSDGAEKARYLYLPPGTQIDTSDMDNWRFPVGAKVWKQFTVLATNDGGASTVVETRLFEKVFDGGFAGWWSVAYLWRPDGSDADAVPDGVPDASGTTHDVPSRGDCKQCHVNVKDAIIGVSAIQLSADGGGGPLTELAKAGLLSSPPPHEYEVPGAGVVKEALGYLHGNCGHCHNDGSYFASESVLRLRLRVSDTIPAATPTYTTSIDVKMFHDLNGVRLGVVPGAPDESQLFVRMDSRDDYQMPPVCTKVVDASGAATLRAWIVGLAGAPDGGTD